MSNSILEHIPCNNSNTNAYNHIKPLSIITPHSVLQQVNSLFHRKFPIPRALVLPPLTSSPHTVRSSAASFNFQYPVVSLRLFSSCLRLLPRLPVPSMLPSITCCGQFLRKMWPILLPFLRFILCRMLFYVTLCNTFTFLTRSVQLIFSILL